MKYSIFAAFVVFTLFCNAQTSFEPIEKSVLEDLISKARMSNEIDTRKLQKFHSEYADVIENPEDPNRVFDYGRILTALLQPGLSTATENPLSKSGFKIAEEAEDAYKSAISNCECHGRANIMLGLLYNQQGKYYISEPYLEKGLHLEEGGEDWMVAANQYLLAGAYTYNTEEDKYQEVYAKFKGYANTEGIKDQSYYLKMAVLYVSYYEK